MSSPRQIVTIVTGNSRVGKAAVEALLRNHPGVVCVRAVVRDLAKGDMLKEFQGEKGFELIEGGDAFREETHEAAFLGTTKAFIVAPQMENRAEAVNLLIDGAKKYGCKHVVLIGGVFQEKERILFHRQWMSSRRHAEAVGVTWTQLECVDFMENVYRCQRGIVESSKMAMPGVDIKTPTVALQDIGAAAAAVLASDGHDHDNRAYRMAGPHPISARHMAGVLSKLLGKNIEVEDQDLEARKQAEMRSGNWQPWQLEGFFEWMSTYFMAGSMQGVTSDLPLLKIQPTSFEEWMRPRIKSFTPIPREERALQLAT